LGFFLRFFENRAPGPSGSTGPFYEKTIKDILGNFCSNIQLSRPGPSGGTGSFCGSLSPYEEYYAGLGAPDPYKEQ